ncbi:PLP-dependent aminotransferase family protein [Halalkalibacter urbisdiaboli]|uniref:MocR-like pyridoxine biosynthesis transcription factor PdxR n=1 Tax=Halalkalibacter urbisdiaboli TaxID=1960589 RepID=UPI000B444100|nr:PLP-dependent aminotransferase family protein [Halalkalibacter urbisdiaboli]
MLEVTPILNTSNKKPLYQQLYQYIKDEIVSGKIQTGARLPSIRQLSKHLAVSRNTVETAYQQLIMEGYVESKPRSGLFVIDIKCELPLLQPRHNPIIEENKNVQQNIDIDFRYGHVDSEHFPYAIWRKLTLNILHPNEKRLFSYGDSQGEYELRLELAKYLRHSRGVECSPEQIVIGAGIQPLISIVFHLINSEGTTVAMEEPGYDGVRAVLENHRLTVKAIPLDKYGINIDTLYKSTANVVYITPSHQFPSGLIMPFSRRLQLLKWAETQNGIIIEDDYDGEFRYVGKPIPALQGLDTNNNVIYIGSLSKSLLPSIRLGYMILPLPLLKRYKQSFQLYDQSVSTIHQMTLHQFIKQGYWERHLRKMRKVYQRKQTTLITEIKRRLGQRVSITGTEAGLHILLEVKNGMCEEELINQALKFKVGVYPVSRHWRGNSNRQLNMVQIGFGGVTEEKIIEGIKRLEKAWFMK